MNEIKIWATNFSVILIVTGLITKLINGKSEKNLLRFVVVLVIVSTIFSIKNISFDDFSLYMFEDIETEISNMSETLSEKIKNDGMKAVCNRIEEIIKEFDKSAKVNSVITENNVTSVIQTDSENLDIQEIKLRLKEEFDCEFEIFIRKK